ncbi:MerR family transcriptional regulator [Paenibacillus allorhizosphaerae]|uniref:Mercuric resistance operon regulatory protein n=1 Tax=Paenibacillus allorhizosphaerae TaxID=2849866 RepID=A0ABM8VDW0_9BACL|nr:MerR family transcriptional regulator [Paenibacillus allorhizosphaerae]CAG7628950.1 Mercuric resistance operon regulatory protein [Paenibacillus allorhizosphaerae]
MNITINEVARLTGVSVRSLRYYEKKKLLIPLRMGNGYRRYNQADVDRIQLIRVYLGLGLGTDDIARFMNCGDTGPDLTDPSVCIHDATVLYENRLKEVRQQMEVLKEQEEKLVQTLNCWNEMLDRLNQGLPVERKEA